jgi:hypothetical protein
VSGQAQIEAHVAGHLIERAAAANQWHGAHVDVVVPAGAASRRSDTTTDITG